MAALRPVLSSGGLDIVALRNADTGKLAWDVEYRVVPYRESRLVSPVNYGNRKTVKLDLKGRANDNLTGVEVDMRAISLEPMEPRLLIRVPTTTPER